MLPLTANLVEAYSALFVHSWEIYAVQQGDGSYWCAHESLFPARLVDHLLGRYTLGTYVLDAAGTCTFAVFDADGYDGMQALVFFAEQLARQGIWTLLEASRRGAHLWIFFAEPVPAALVRAWLLPFAVQLGVELYPKQDTLRSGPGSLIRLPLGIHRQTGGWYPFLRRDAHGQLVPVGETVTECLAWAVASVQRVQVPHGIEVRQEARDAGVDVCAHGIQLPTSSPLGSEWMRGHGAIHAWCQSQDIVQVIGRYVQLDYRGVGSCPFKEHHARGDRRPSFQVFGGQDPHWYCYTSQRAGDLFDFFCVYYQLSHQEAWQWLQAGRFV
jgi:CHC2 zinc finger